MNDTSATKMHPIIRFMLGVTGAVALTSPLGIAFAETPPSVPLSLQASVPPNIFFLNDDSGSMDYELLIQDTEFAARLGQDDGRMEVVAHRSIPFSKINTPVYNPDGPHWCNFIGNTPFDDIDNDGRFPGYAFILETNSVKKCDVVSEKEWRARLYEVNSLYYNPSKTYSPWPGVDADGEALYKDMDIETAVIDPAAKESPAINLKSESAELVSRPNNRSLYDTSEWKAWCEEKFGADATCKGWRYYTWSDGNNDGEISSNELTVHWVKDLAKTEQTNFANWFSYHRSRKGAARYALGKAIIAAEGSRIGYGAINEITHNTNKQVLIDYSSINHQLKTLKALYSPRTSSIGKDTPLQKSFAWVGEYFKNDGAGDLPASPILDENNGGACQVNNAILMTDGFYTDEEVGSSGIPKFYKNSNIDDADGDGYDDTLADIAMYYYVDDLDDTISNEVPPSDDGVDTASQQHLNTYTISFGLTGTLPENVDINAEGFVWPDPKTATYQDSGKSIPERIDDLFHAAVNGRGKYLNAGDPETLIESLGEIVRSIIDGRQMGNNSIATSSFILNDQSKIFVTNFDASTWAGELRAYSGNTDPNTITKATPEGDSGLLWSTDNTLTEGMSRTILTYDADTGTGIPFRWNDLPDKHKAMLTNDPDADADDLNDSEQQGQSRLNYLRGGIDSSFRARSSVLGDVIASSPRFVGIPPMIYPDADPFGADGVRYQAFWEAHSLNSNARTPVVYVGANDGMLHGFNAETGEEVLAYVPYSVFDKLKELTNVDYSHKFFVDQTPTIAETFFNPRREAANASWNTALVGGLGTGGKGLFALNVTNPANFSEANVADIVLWEFTNDDDADMGYSQAKPTIALLESGRWAAITGNGYESDNGDSVLFILYLDADPSDGWSEGTDSDDDYTKIVISDSDNGLFSPTVVDSDGDGMMDRVYAGDLKGNLWAFDLTSSDAGEWKVAYDDKGSPQPLFKASANATAQPITAKPTVIRHPTESPGGAAGSISLMVYFGTGKFFLSSDLNDKSLQSFYAIWDTGTKGNLDRDDLTAQSMIAGEDSEVGINARVTENITLNYSDESNSERFGWYLDLKDKDDEGNDILRGERIFSPAVYARGIILFTTYTPFGGACGGGGSGWLMFLDARDGSYSDQPIININGDTVIDNDDKVTLGNTTTTPSGIQGLAAFSTDSLTLSNDRTIRGTTGGVEGSETNLFGDISGSRMSWKELRPE